MKKAPGIESYRTERNNGWHLHESSSSVPISSCSMKSPPPSTHRANIGSWSSCPGNSKKQLSLVLARSSQLFMNASSFLSLAGEAQNSLVRPSQELNRSAL